jgi:DDE_Tnp_1-associated
MSQLAQGIQDHFKELPEYRKRKVRKHPLLSIIFIALCAMLAGADAFTDMELWAIKYRKWLEERIDLPNGIPSHDTIRRFFELSDKRVFFECFLSWTYYISAEKMKKMKIIMKKMIMKNMIMKKMIMKKK